MVEVLFQGKEISCFWKSVFLIKAQEVFHTFQQENVILLQKTSYLVCSSQL